MTWVSVGIAGAGMIGGGLIGRNQAQHAAANISNVPQSWGTSLGSSNIGGMTSLDPSIRANQNQLLAQYQGLYPQAGGYANQAAGMYGNLLGQAQQNQTGFVDASIAPTQRLIDQTYGNLIQDQQNRSGGGPGGLRGSSLAGDQMGNFVLDASTALTNATSQAQQQGYALQSGLIGNQMNAGLSGIQTQQGLLGAQNVINQQNLAQELQSLGLDQSQTQILLNQQMMANQARAGGNAAMGSGLMGLGDLLGSVF